MKSQMKRYTGWRSEKPWAEELRPCAVGTCHLLLWGCVHHPRSSPHPVVKSFIFMETSTCRHDQLSIQSPISFLPSLEDGAWRWKFQASNRSLVFFYDMLPSRSYPETHQELPHGNQRCPSHSGNYRVFRSSVSWTEGRGIINKYICYIIYTYMCMYIVMYIMSQMVIWHSKIKEICHIEKLKHLAKFNAHSW